MTEALPLTSIPCAKCTGPLEASRNAALSDLCAACYAKADDHLVLVRVKIPRWKVIQWWICAHARDARVLASKNAEVGTPPVMIKAAMRNAIIRRVDLARVASRVVRTGGWRAGLPEQVTLSDAAMEPWTTLSIGKRGQPRLIGFEYFGSRLRDEG